jgi:hypothetical protein
MTIGASAKTIGASQTIERSRRHGLRRHLPAVARRQRALIRNQSSYEGLTGP